MALCIRCDRDFATIAGLNIHLNRMHPLSDEWARDFVNLTSAEQETLLAALSDLKGVTLSKTPTEISRAMFDILYDPGPGDTARMRDLLGIYTKIEYRYVILEEP